MNKRQDGLAVLISIKNEGQLPWLLDKLKSIFGNESIDSLYMDDQITITIGKRDFREEHREIILDCIRKFDGIILDEVEIYDHFQ